MGRPLLGMVTGRLFRVASLQAFPPQGGGAGHIEADEGASEVSGFRPRFVQRHTVGRGLAPAGEGDTNTEQRRGQAPALQGA